MDAIKKIFSRWGKNTPPQKYKVVPDSTTKVRVIHLYQHLNIDEILPRKHPRFFKDYDPGILQKSAYCALELPYFITSLVQRFEQDPKAKALLSSPILKLETYKGFLDRLSRWKNMLNRCFFAGSLSNTDIVLENMNPRRAGYCFWSPEKSEIHINPESEMPYNFTGTFEEFSISALLHEMVHIFMFSYLCQESCCDSRSFMHPSCGGIGSCGHGPPFLDSLSVITDSLRRVVEWPVDPLIEMSAQISMCIDDWQPNITQLELWGLDLLIWGDVDTWDKCRDKILQQRAAATGMIEE